MPASLPACPYFQRRGLASLMKLACLFRWKSTAWLKLFVCGRRWLSLQEPFIRVVWQLHGLASLRHNSCCFPVVKLCGLPSLLSSSRRRADNRDKHKRGREEEEELWLRAVQTWLVCLLCSHLPVVKNEKPLSSRRQVWKRHRGSSCWLNWFKQTGVYSE